jgi:Flp pilus assembly protein TadD
MSTSVSRIRLSVAVIVRDAAKALEETLAAVKPLGGEVVVLDTGSTDHTRNVAHEHGAVLVERAWDDDFSAARNYCLARVRGDWVLWLDAGETLSLEDAIQLREYVAHKAEPHSAYMLLVKVPPLAGNISGEQIGRIRLVPNLPGLRFSGRVRESLAASLASHGIQVEGLPWRIHRGLREHDPEHKQAKARRDIRIAELEIRERGPSPALLNCRGEAAQTLGDKAQAARHFRGAIDSSDRGSTEMQEAYYGLLTSLEGQPNARQVQLTTCLEALEVYPLDAQLLCAMGGYLQGLGRLDLATRAYQTAHQFGRVNPCTWHLDAMSEIAAVCYALALILENKDEEARRVLEDAVAAHPDSIRLRRHLIDVLVKQGASDVAMTHVDHLPSHTPHHEALRSAVRGACLASSKNWIPARAYLRAAYDAGCRDALLMRWLSITLLSLGESEAARAALLEWKSAEPASPEVHRYLEAIAAAIEGGSKDSTPAIPASPGSQDRLPAEGRRMRIDKPDPADPARAPLPNVGTSQRLRDPSEPPAAV